MIIDKEIKSKRGSTALLFALSAAILVCAIGSGVDLSRLSNDKSKAQAMIDAAILAPFSNETYHEGTESVLKVSKAYLDSQSKNQNIEFKTYSVYKTSGGYQAVGTFETKTLIAGILGIDKLTGTVESSVAIRKVHLEVVFVLDTSGSMTGTRITNLKSGVTSAIAKINSWSARFKSVKMSIVPFSSLVNIGNTKDSSYMDLNGLNSLHSYGFDQTINRFDVFDNIGHTWKGCTQGRAKGYDITDEPAKATDAETLFVPWFWPDEPDNNKKYPNNYLTSNSKGNDKANGKDVTKYGVNGPNKSTWLKPGLLTTYDFYFGYSETQGPNFFCDSQPITPLTNDVTKLNNAVASLNAMGGTNLTEGLAWGWRVLSPAVPFTEGLPYSGENQKILIFFTDGSNAANALNNEFKSEFTTWGYADDGPLNAMIGGKTKPDNLDLKTAMDTKTKAICENIKKQEIEIFTVGLSIENEVSRTILKDCASKIAYYTEATSDSEIGPAFDNIIKRVMNLHLSQ